MHGRSSTAWTTRLALDYDAASLSGTELAPSLTAPISPLIADGSAVTIHWRNPISN